MSRRFVNLFSIVRVDLRDGEPRTGLRDEINRFLIFAFVDNVFLHRWWRCHQMGERSFFVCGRQFHICARCTGILVGYLISPLFILWGDLALCLFPASAACMALDGLTQLLRWRTSNNALRLATGLCFGLTLLPFIIHIIGVIVDACRI